MQSFTSTVCTPLNGKTLFTHLYCFFFVLRNKSVNTAVTKCYLELRKEGLHFS